ncbi:MAG: hypothetical protein GEV12_08605 [Micromonosporaceae bacterium]|nr:hypothetical protein [Micromonosporaceae bacterium]
MGKLTAPPDLAADGRAFLTQLDAWLVAERLSFDPHELVLVLELARTTDRMATIREALAAVPVTEPAWVRLAGEERQQRLAYGRLTSTLALPTGVAEPTAVPAPAGRTPRSRRAQKAARARWGTAA